MKTLILLLKKMFRFTKDLNSRRSAKVTERLNEVYSTIPAKLDPALNCAQMMSVERDAW
jgi:hypothetical protein